MPQAVAAPKRSATAASHRNINLVSHDQPERSPSDRAVSLELPSVSSAAIPIEFEPATAASTQPSSLQEPAGMALAEIESIAMANNPTIRELAAIAQKAVGYRTQVGLRANPVVGYQGQQLADMGTDQHLAFVEQEIATGGKLELNRRVQNEAVRAQLLDLEAQKLRVVTDIRVRFASALVAQRRLELINEFRSVGDRGLELAELRRRAAEGSKLDVLQARIQKSEVDLAQRQAEIGLAAAWSELVAMAGVPHWPGRRLLGELPESSEAMEWMRLKTHLLDSSPEVGAARARVQQARLALQRQDVQPLPNLQVQFGAGVDKATDSGMINVQVGAPLPVFNRNEGNIAAARAEVCRALLDLQRIENSIQARLAVVSQEFDSALAAVSVYSTEILPSARESLQLAELAYKAGETSFVQVLVARRTYFESNLEYIRAQAQLAQAQAKLDGYLLSDSLAPVTDQSGDDSLRESTFSQQ